MSSKNSLTKSDICVVIPVHKSQPSDNEVISLQQAGKILRDYSRYLFVPRNFDAKVYLSIDPDLRIIEQDPGFFQSERGYNTMCRRPLFYEPFLSYKYMLLYQSDSFVFRDELFDWCRRGFDYIGPPWLRTEKILVKFGTARLRWLAYFLNPVGNGGFSLRNIKKFFKLSKLFQYISASLIFHEDILWSNVAPVLLPGFRIPDKSTAMTFAFEGKPELCFQMNGGKLPFGCHAWEKQDRVFWARIFADYGYKVILQA